MLANDRQTSNINSAIFVNGCADSGVAAQHCDRRNEINRVSLDHTKCAHDEGTQCSLAEIIFLLRHRQQVGEDRPIIVARCSLHVWQFGRVLLLALTSVIAMRHDDSAPNTVFEGNFGRRKAKG